ncbi:putative dual specificity phosphatase [Diaporthe ampelina]|uniref:Putative dual specificity phosphatase n=1 Tax=Diaporthe ampelina TaxID=1214573 RepID=A0A0G2FI26_9PEZI|nr:putative dual specificity phosphatase [Diaporthe ampelina]
MSILYRELDLNYPNERWFDSYDSFNKKLRSSKSKNTEKILADLPILVGVKDGLEHLVGLQEAVQDTISYLLDVEAEWNPVTAINSQPEGCSSALWKGRLWLGGIKDSVNNEVLKKQACDVSAVVSIHPEDWLAKDMWKALYEKWDGKPSSLKPGWTRDKSMGQYLIELEDNSSSDLLAYFCKAFQFMDYYLLQGKNVLVHCKMGQSRSASLVLGYMITRHYKLHMHVAGGPTSKQEASRDLEKLRNALEKFTDDISVPVNGPDGTSPPAAAEGKRKGINTKKFEPQLLQYLEQLAKGHKTELVKQSKPAEKKGGGGILKDAILVLCFMHDLKPTREILGYWSRGKKANIHYWAKASKDKTGKDIDDNDALAQAMKFFNFHSSQ